MLRRINTRTDGVGVPNANLYGVFKKVLTVTPGKTIEALSMTYPRASVSVSLFSHDDTSLVQYIIDDSNVATPPIMTEAIPISKGQASVVSLWITKGYSLYIRALSTVTVSIVYTEEVS